MTYTITANNGAGTSSPELIEGYTPSRQSRNLIHDLLDGSIGVAYQAPRPRSGQLRLLYTSESAAFAALALHAQETSFTLSSSDMVAMGMTYALDGSVDLDVQAQLSQWWVSIGYQELSV